MSQCKKNLSIIILFNYLMAALSVIGTILLLLWVLKYSYYGIDFTDEGLYLLSIMNPFIYDSTITQFGFIYYIFYGFLDGSISALRQANILFTFGLSWCLSYSLMRSFVTNVSKDFVSLYVISFGLSSSFISSLFFSGHWLATPNYNSLNFQSLLITSIGLIYTKKVMNFKSVLGCLVVGFGGWLAFMAKPSTALALAVGVFFYLIMSRKISIWLILITTLSALTFLLLSALLIDGSPLLFLQRIQRSLEFSQLLNGGHNLNQIFHLDGSQLISLQRVQRGFGFFQLLNDGYTLNHFFRFDSFRLNSKDIAVGCFIILALFCCFWEAWSESKVGSYASLLLFFTFFTFIILLISGTIYVIGRGGQFLGLMFLFITLATVLFALRFKHFKIIENITSDGWATFFLFILMPCIFAFGTNNNYWRLGGAVAIFWLLAGLPFWEVIVRERGTWLIALPLVFSTQAITAVLIQTGFEHPYRQPDPLSHNETSLEIGGFQKSTLILSNDYAPYLSNVIQLTKKSGFRYGTPMIDLTGQSPAILYAIGAEAIGQAWIIGGYTGSLNRATAVLRRTSCEKIAMAWVLSEPDGPRSISIDLMSNLGAKFPKDYKKVATWDTAKGAGGYVASRTQELYMPLDPNITLKICDDLRKNDMPKR